MAARAMLREMEMRRKRKVRSEARGGMWRDQTRRMGMEKIMASLMMERIAAVVRVETFTFEQKRAGLRVQFAEKGMQMVKERMRRVR